MKRLLPLILLLSSLSASAEESNETIVIATASWAKATEQDLSGYYFDIARKIFEPRGIKLEVTFVPYKRALYLVRSKSADALFGTYSAAAENKDYLITPKYPIDSERTVAVFRKKDAIKWQGEKTLTGKKVSWILGYDYQHSLSVPFSLKEVTDTTVGLRLLEIGRIDFYLDAALDVEPLIKASEFKFESATLLKDYLYVAFTNNDKGERLARIYDEEFLKLYHSGEVERIFRKYQLTPRISLPAE